MAHFMFNAILTTANDLVPNMVRNSLHSAYHYLVSPKEITIIVDEHENSQVSSVMSRNQIFEAAMVYLPTKIGPDTRRFKVSKTPSQGSLKTGIEPGVEVADRFGNNVVLKWKLTHHEESEFEKKKRFFELSFKKKYKDRVLDGYLEFVMKESAEIVKNMEKVVTIRGNPDRDQCSLTLNYPITFDKLAMDPELKQAIIDDLDTFKKGQEFYRKVGKAWKRGYLLHGPPGTGKSSLIAAMANHLKYDVYDLELASLQSDKDLRRILLSTPNQSIIVIEDIDCNVELQVRRTGTTEGSNNPKLTLSGLLNFVDGLWSSCGDERIIVFTTNHKDRLYPALLRPGRMDMVIHMPYCTGQGFRLLAKNYLDINDHRLFGEIEGIMENVKVTPAEVAGQLMSSRKVDIALTGVVNLLKRKMEANEIEEDEANR